MRIAVLCGGTSEERQVSIASAANVVGALRARGHEVSVVDLAHGPMTRELEAAFLAADVPAAALTSTTDGGHGQLLLEPTLLRTLSEADVVFLALHGGTGENGTVQSVLELAGVPYTGSGPLGSALAMDKDVSKTLLRESGILTPDWLLPGRSDRAEIADKLGFPMIVKPCAEGSTIGLSLVGDMSELDEAIAVAQRFGAAMCERFIRGREITVGVLGDEALAVGEVIIDEGSAFTYDEKYQTGTVLEVFPADLPALVSREAQRVALASHDVLKLETYSRSDFRLDQSGKLWMIEVNSLPGMTRTSLMPQSAAADGIDVGSLCERICLEGRARGIAMAEGG
jgi:D-alanine-D-alanine ligase